MNPEIFRKKEHQDVQFCSTRMIYIGKTPVAVGYGSVDSKTVLRQSRLNILNQRECINEYTAFQKNVGGETFNRLLPNNFDSKLFCAQDKVSVIIFRIGFMKIMVTVFKQIFSLLNMLSVLEIQVDL